MNILLTELVEIFSRGVLLLGLAFLGSLVLRHASAAFISHYWRTAVVAALLLPAVPTLWTFQKNRTLPETTPVPAPVATSAPAPAPAPIVPIKRTPAPAPDIVPLAATSPASPIAATPAPSRPSSGWLTSLVLAAWLFGALVVLGRWISGAVAFRRLCAAASPAGDTAVVEQCRELAAQLGLRRAPALRTHTEIAIPMVGGLLRPCILLPVDCARWDTADRRMVLMHELVHIRRRDALFHLLSALTKALHCANPFAWIAAHSIRDAAERATDDRVLANGTPGPGYARLLVEFASRQMATPSPAAPAAASAMAQPHTVESRVHRILDSKQRRSQPHRLVVAALTVAFATLLAGIGGSAFAEEQKVELAASAESTASASTLRQKLESIIIPDADFHDATLEEVVAFCTRESRLHDPEKRGINLILSPNSGEGARPTITLNLKQIPLGELLRYAGALANLTLAVEPHCAVFRPGREGAYDLETKIYTIAPEFMERLRKRVSAGESPDPFAGGSSYVPYHPDARDCLSEIGITFPEGATARYEEVGSRLILRNTPSNLALFDAVTASMSNITAPSPTAALRTKMRASNIPSLSFNDASLEEAIDYLLSEIEGPPISIVVFPPTGSENTISLDLRDIPFGAALGYITEFGGYSYRVEAHAVVLRPRFGLVEDLEIRTIPISAPHLQGRFAEEGFAIYNWLREIGISFPDGAAAHFEPIGRNLIVRNLPDTLDLLETTLAAIPVE